MSAPIKHKFVLLFAVLFLLCPAQAEPRLQPQDLKYIGAFRLPDGPEEYAWLWSGQALAYNPDGNPKRRAQELPGSLFGVGHDWNQYVSEISIPKPLKSKNLKDLPTARTLQEFTDIKGGLYEPLEQARAGLAYLPAQGAQTSPKLYFCWDSHMHEGHTGPSHGWCETNLSAPHSAGPWAIEGLTTYLTSDYLFPLSQEWAERHTAGKCWYGFANGVVWPEDGPYPPVPDYPNDERGWWSTGFSAQILFYDSTDLASVAEGKLKSWKPQPYAVMSIDDVLYGGRSKRRLRRLGACAYDPVGKFLYVLEHRGDDDKSGVHCWKVGR